MFVLARGSRIHPDFLPLDGATDLAAVSSDLESGANDVLVRGDKEDVCAHTSGGWRFAFPTNWPKGTNNRFRLHPTYTLETF